MQKNSNNNYQLVFLLSDLGFPVSNNLFGQLSIVLDLCRLIDKKIDIYILTNGKSIKTKIPSNIHVVYVNDPLMDKLSYYQAVKNIITGDKTTIAVSFMIHRDSEAICELSKLKNQFSNFKIIIGLHCTAGEYFYDKLPITESLSSDARKYIMAKNVYTETMKKYLGLMAKNQSIDKFIVPNEYTKKSFVAHSLSKTISKDKLYVTPSGADEEIFKPMNQEEELILKKKYKINADEFIVCFGTRFTQYKGSDILEDILNFYNGASVTSPTFLFPIYPNSDTVYLCNSLLKYKNLLRNNKVKFFLELSRQKKLLGNSWDLFYKKSEEIIKSFINELPVDLRPYVKKNYLGIMDVPYYHLVNLMLRPSLAESQGITLFESSLCNCLTIGSDRVGFYHDVPELARYSVKLPSTIQVNNRYSNYKTSKYLKSIKFVANKFITMIESEKVKYNKKMLPSDIRNIIIQRGFTSEAMTTRYTDLFESLIEN